MKTFRDKVVWITGASSGIGEALASAFSKEDAILVLSARRVEELERVRKHLGLPNEKVMILPFDVSETDQAREVTEMVIGRFGRIDVLVNNAGISQRSWAKETPLAIDRKIMEINYFGTIALTKQVVPYMISRKSGHILVMSSIAGKFGFYLRSAYSASKHALHGFFEALRMELHKDNIRVTIACPGKVNTNISVNALTNTGDKHNVMDAAQEKGISAYECARIIIGAMKKKQVRSLCGRERTSGGMDQKIFPFFFHKGDPEGKA